MSYKSWQRNHQWIKWALYLSFFAFAFHWIYTPALPTGAEILPSLTEEPQQTKLRKTTLIPYERSGKTYYVKPTHHYELTGLVVSKNHMKSWLDPAYRKYDARIQDFCVVWGENATSGIMDKIRVRNSNFTCHVFGFTQADWSQFDIEGLSNNHILASDPTTIKTLKNIEVGDQIRLKGQLANYYADRTGRQLIRATSTVRTDGGDGACETFFVNSAEILAKSEPAKSRLINSLSALLPWLLLTWFASFVYGLFLDMSKYKRRKSTPPHIS